MVRLGLVVEHRRFIQLLLVCLVHRCFVCSMMMIEMLKTNENQENVDDNHAMEKEGGILIGKERCFW